MLGVLFRRAVTKPFTKTSLWLVTQSLHFSRWEERLRDESEERSARQAIRDPPLSNLLALAVTFGCLFTKTTFF